MKLFDKISKMFKKPEPEKDDQTIMVQLEEVTDFLSKNLNKVKDVKDKSEDYKEKILTKITKLRLAIEALKSAEPNKKFPEKVILMGESLRAKLCEDTLRLIDNLPNGMQGLLAESKNLINMLKLDAKKTEILSVLFEKNIQEIVKLLIEFNSEINSFEKFIKKDFVVIKMKDEIDSLVEDVLKQKKKVSESSEKILELSKEISTLIKKRKDIEIKIKEIEEYKKSEEVSKLDAEIEKLEQANKKILSDLDTKFSEINKALKKFKYAKSKSEDLPQRIIDEYLRSPSKAVISDNKLEIINILSELKAAIESELDFDEKQKAKLSSAIDEITKEYLLSQQKQFEMNINLLEEVNVQKTQLLAPVAFNEKTMEREVEGLKSDIMKVEADKAIEEKIKEKNKSELVKAMNELRQKVSEITNKNIEIVY